MRFLSCSVLPVRMACNLDCHFCFSKSSVSALDHEGARWDEIDIDGFYQYSRDHGAERLVITGGGEPLLKPDLVRNMIQTGTRYFDEIALFTNGCLLTESLSQQLQSDGLSYLCFSRHHYDDDKNRRLMGEKADDLDAFFNRCGDLKIRATCVMCRDFIDTREQVWNYINTLRNYGVTEFTFKHTYTAYEESVFRDSPNDLWVKERQVDFDPFQGEGLIVGELPWGPKIYNIDELKVCYYYEPTPHWEQKNRICRSSNLLSDGSVYASLENRQSLLFHAIKS